MIRLFLCYRNSVGPHPTKPFHARSETNAPSSKIKKPAIAEELWRAKSGRQDSNLGPPGPKPGTLPDCATPRTKNFP
jgi:hypothetical protein